MSALMRALMKRRQGLRGQALVEFAIVLPLLAGMTGGVIDFARVYQASVTLQSATRSAAEAAATLSVDNAGAQAEALRVVCTETQDLPGFVPGPGNDIASCTAPGVSLTSFTHSTTAPGASAAYPLASATVRSELDFQLLIPWPFLEGGQWTLTTTQSYSVIQGR